MKIAMLLRLLFVLIVAVAPALAQQSRPVVATGLSVAGSAREVTVTVPLSRPLAAPPRAFALPQPMRWAVDLSGASASRIEAGGAGTVKAARVGQFDADIVRVVIDLSAPMRIVKAEQDAKNRLLLTLAPIDAAGFRGLVSRGRNPIPGFTGPAVGAPAAGRLEEVEAILTEQLRAQEAAGKAVAKPVIAPAAPRPAAGKPPATAAPPPAPPSPVVAPPTEAAAAAPRPRGRDGRKPLVVIDPGHGGKDVGAISVNGGYEKTVTLAIAQAAKRAIERDGRLRVRLTRDDDRFLTLGQRQRLARDWGADLFISVHADSAPNAAARGASVYTLSEVASDAQAARLAAKENNADAIAGVTLRGQDRETTGLLIDLAQRDSMNASVDFAQGLQAALEPEGVRFRSRFHHFAGFAVLKNVGVPAVLLETGYLSNAEDSDYLFDRDGQRAVAAGIARAAAEFLTGTQVARR
ncbi:N-acetylmuramoyl-L-alanine amidase [Sandaracinobacteroides saxicola]|uniref:N-acetylmuramoyl-L-alanine amidase n=1 Tax=Sandaracinobacteroides saxicola TaxID=2759707 RepID=A0A7G5IGW6_9SPHN|nr:N-acetylmuramoyl-L-alanine amidase [Sandaracinobacteroides saxicola]QMW22608.1 N-acetylmuramoyl-L-alanine amidase [Sandaracinobacteroides saxicola]